MTDRVKPLRGHGAVRDKNAPEYSELAFLVKYQLLSLLETVKNMMNQGGKLFLPT